MPFKFTVQNKEREMTSQDTNCYTYEINMVVQVLAENEMQAKIMLDQQGGFISKREVVLSNTVNLYKE